jgi:hypothetical protein
MADDPWRTDRGTWGRALVEPTRALVDPRAGSELPGETEALALERHVEESLVMSVRM